jgi:N6-L-threonylcarbamoyladenine synthase
VGLVLAIESSCDETAAALVDQDLFVRSSVIATQIPVHMRYGGVVPELASRSHLTAIGTVITEALEQAEATLEDLEAVAVTAGPGLAGCLLVGLQTAKSLAWARRLPLVLVDHIQAHHRAIFLRDAQGAGESPPVGAYLALVASGGHTSLLRVDGDDDVKVVGQTLDDAAGEAFDKAAKMMGLDYPGGVHIDRIATSGDASAVKLPRPMLGKGLDFSFSGLKTAVRYKIEELDPATIGDEGAMADLAASTQEAIVDVLVAKSMQACTSQGIDDLVLAGGVACNSRLRARLREEAQARGVRVHLVPPRYCTDNAAMVGGLGVTHLAAGRGLTGRELTEADIYVTRRPSQGATR